MTDTESHSHQAPRPLDGAPPSARQAWDEHYQAREQIWSGRANAVLVEMVAPLIPGTALDLGSGEGGDAVWLAQQGWQVLAVDVSDTALSRTSSAVAAAGLTDRVGFERHDLAESFPDGTFDLVSAQYLHSWLPFPREEVLRRAAAAVAPGGLLLIVGHAHMPPWSEHRHEEVTLPSAAEVLASLALSDNEWEVERAEDAARETTGPDGQLGVLSDAIVAARRLRVE